MIQPWRNNLSTALQSWQAMRSYLVIAQAATAPDEQSSPSHKLCLTPPQRKHGLQHALLLVCYNLVSLLQPSARSCRQEVPRGKSPADQLVLLPLSHLCGHFAL